MNCLKMVNWNNQIFFPSLSFILSFSLEFDLEKMVGGGGGGRVGFSMVG